jgi:hypothetical protein
MEEKANHINASGFPLQIGLAHAIDATTNSHGWRVLYQEHGWRHKQTEESGFIDLVVQNRYEAVLLNVECKRPQDTTWQFLLPQPEAKQTRACKFWVSFNRGPELKRAYFDWLDLSIDPASYESEYCVVAGQDSKSRPMLERVAATVVSATEALAKEEGPLLGVEKLRTYINVIVTTAKLQVCKFDPSKIDLHTGTIGDAQYENVPFIRFRKQLSTQQPNTDPSKLTRGYGWSQIARAKENTVLVVQAAEFLNLLPELELDNGIGPRILGQQY